VGDMNKDLGEIYRRLTLAAIHKAGTLVRKTELERAKMQALPLLRMTEALEKSLRDVRPLKRLTDLFKAKGNKELVNGLFKFIGDVGSTPAYLTQIGSLVDSVNMLRDRLKKEGLVFEFPEIMKPLFLEVAKQVTLPSIRGFLKGILEAS